MGSQSLDYKQLAKNIAMDYRGIGGLMGIIWIGSASFGIIDELSDIDIRLLTSSSSKSFPMKQFRVKGVKIEVDEMNWDWVLKDNNVIGSEQFWIREKAVILYDPNNQVQNAFTKTNNAIRFEYDAQLWELFKQTMMEYEVEKCVKRGDISTAMLYLNLIVDRALRFLLFYHDRLIPPFKWRNYFLNKNKAISIEMKKHICSLISCTTAFNNKILSIGKLERLFKELMIKKGFEPKKVEEYWRY